MRCAQKQHLVILTISLFAGNIFAQQQPEKVPGKLQRFLEKSIADIVQNGSDTVIVVSQTIASPIPKNIKGIGNIITLSDHYLFYKKAGELLSVKVIQYLSNENDSIIIAGSKILKSVADIIFPFIGINYKTISRENIQPYQYKDYDFSKGMEIVRVLRTSHAPIYELELHAGKEKITKTINLDDLIEKKWDDGPANVNYAVNSKTILAKFMLSLVSLIEKQDTLFIY